VIVDLRAVTPADAESVADVYLRSRKELVACAPLVHADGSVRKWIREHLLPAGGTTVAVVEDLVVGFLSVSNRDGCSFIDQLYLLPGWVGLGIGTQLLELARNTLPAPIRLYAFQCNHRARYFYERRGFLAVSFGDGAGNEEQCPDVLYEWRPSERGAS